jgi:hypothetical protein
MNEAYKGYLIDMWKEAEEIAKEIGAPSNQNVRMIFDKITQPYFYWAKEMNGNKKVGK